MRLSERILAIYFTYVTLLSLTLGLPSGVRARTLVVNGLLLLGYTILLGSARFRDSIIARHMRDWIPLALMLLAYKEMGWLATAGQDHHLERSWVVWDHALLGDWRLRDLIESAGPVFPSILELCYLLVYALPAFSMAMVYVYRRTRYADNLLVVYLLGLFLSYVQFPWWPSEPPWTVFPGVDAPTVDTLVRRFNGWILGGYGIHTGVFPSAHVSGAVAAAFAMKRIFRDRPWLYGGVFLYAILVAIATVYGRYHYAADAAAGALMGTAAAMIGQWLIRISGKPGLEDRLELEEVCGGASGR